MIFKYDEKTDIHHYYIIDLPMLGIRLQQRYYRKAPLSGKRTGFSPAAGRRYCIPFPGTGLPDERLLP